MWHYIQELIITTFLSVQFFFGGVGQITEQVPVANTEKDSVSVNAGATTTALVTRVIDGDTIDVTLEEDSGTTRVRYIGIDTPESSLDTNSECGSAEATARNSELVGGKTIALVPGTGLYDKYGRLLAYVYVGGIFINETLLTEGLADTMTIPPNTEYYKKFTDLRNKARSDRVGIWESCR